MCGIVGIVGLNSRPIDTAVLQRMNDRQAHRGPDGEGFLLAWINRGSFQQSFVSHTRSWNPAQPVSLGLGHRRLAILDLSERGLQPMPSPDGRVWIVFNGEIYNFRILRRRLQSLGHRFESLTDTEVVLQAYLHWGADCLAHLEGMFAFAIWDSISKRLFCARDRFGIKPFYYASPNGYFIFASEMKSLLDFPDLEAKPDDEAVLGFLVHGNCDYGKRTLLQRVKALDPGHALVLDPESGQPVVHRYWQLLPQPINGVRDRERIAELRELLAETTRRHLISDVRVGSCLSGGLDSSTVVALIEKTRRDEPAAATAVGERLCTFTSCWDYPEIDEREYALSAAQAAGAKPHLVFPSVSDFWDNFARLVWHQDMPFYSLSFYAQWCVMRAAKAAGVKVLLDGQGGDEVFGGYAKFRYAYWASLLRAGRVSKMVHEVRAAVRNSDPYVLDIRSGYRYLPKRVRRFLKVDSLLQNVLRADWNQLLAAEATPATRWWRNALNGRAAEGSWTPMQRIQLDDIMFDTLPALLRMEDRSSMAFSLEARVPFLDHKLVEFGVCLPDRLKIQDGWSKFAIRQAMDQIMPDKLRLRKTKLGFASPDRRWLSADLRRQVTELIHDDLRCQNYLDPAALRRWYASNGAQRANADSYLGLFRVLSLEMWMRVFHLN